MNFTEIQSYGWLFNITAVSLLTAVFLLIWRFAEKKSYVLFIIPFALLIGYFMVEKLETRIDESGIHYRMFPIQLAEKNIAWSEAVSVSIKDQIIYSRVVSRYDVYSIDDKYGIYINLMYSKSMIIGTKKPDEIRSVLAHLGK
jgi:hypothetical protein